MALFGFSDIQFNKGVTTRNGPLGSLVDNKFKTTTLRYPMDIGSYDKAHYLVFYIREQKNTQYKGTTVPDNVFDEINQQNQSAAEAKLNSITNLNLNTSIGGELLTKVNNGLDKINQATGGNLTGLTSAVGKAAGGVVGSVNNLFGQKTAIIGGNSSATQAYIDTSIKKITGGSTGLLRTTQLTTDAIALYMPDTLQYTQAQGYDQLNLGGELGGQVLAAAQSAIDAYKAGGKDAAVSSIVASAAKGGGKAALNALGDKLKSSQTAQFAFTAATGLVTNPMLEMIYKTPNFRNFQFDFTFYPRDEREALEVQKIIERLRFHQSPELDSSKGFLIPPSEFDIKFYYGGVQNPNIPAIATCVLTNIDVNYAPNGWSAYEIPGENQPALGRTGMPVAIQLTLQFQETTFLTKADFKTARGFTKNDDPGYNQTNDKGEGLF